MYNTKNTSKALAFTPPYVIYEAPEASIIEITMQSTICGSSTSCGTDEPDDFTYGGTF